MFDWLKRLKTKAVARINKVVLQNGSTLQYPHWKIREQMADGYERNTVVYACVNLIAKTAAAIPLALYQQVRAKRQEVEDEKHPLLTLLNRPNPMAGRVAFMTDLFTYWMSTGNSFIWANKIGVEPRQLWSLPPSRFQIMPGTKIGVVDHYEYSVDTQSNQMLKVEDTLHLKLFHTEQSEWFGLSPVQVGALVIDTDNVAVNWNRSLLSNRGRPDSVFSFKQPLMDEQHEAFRKRLDDSYGGDSNGGKPLIVSGSDFSYTQLSTSPLEMDYVASTSMNGRRICQIFGVAPELIGDPQNKTYSNQAEARLALVEQVVFPLMDYYVDALNNWLAPMFGDNLAIEYDKDAVDVISDKRSAKYVVLSGADFLSVNEKREAVGYDKIEDEDADVPESLLSARSFAANTQPFDAPPEEAGDEEPDQADDGDADDEQDPQDKQVISLETKWLNLDTEEKKLSFWRDMDARKRGMERGAEKVFARHFVAEGRKVAAAYKSSGQAGALAAVKSNERKLAAIYKGVMSQVGRYFFNQAATSINRGAAKKDVSTALRGLSAFLNAQASTKAAQVTATTQEKVAAMLQKLILGGNATDNEIVDEIAILYGEQFAKSRAAMIASTEVGNAANAGSLFGAKSTDKDLKKVWISMRDDRVRDTHQEADGQTVELDALFKVCGEELEFPGDSSHGASAACTINCRCQVAYEEAS